MNKINDFFKNCFSVPLTSYFLDFAPLIMNDCYYRRISDSSNSKSNGKLAKSYLKYLQSMWIKPSNEFQKFYLKEEEKKNKRFLFLFILVEYFIQNQFHLRFVRLIQCFVLIHNKFHFYFILLFLLFKNKSFF